MKGSLHPFIWMNFLFCSLCLYIPDLRTTYTISCNAVSEGKHSLTFLKVQCDQPGHTWTLCWQTRGKCYAWHGLRHGKLAAGFDAELPSCPRTPSPEAPEGPIEMMGLVSLQLGRPAVGKSGGNWQWFLFPVLLWTWVLVSLSQHCQSFHKSWALEQLEWGFCWLPQA